MTKYYDVRETNRMQDLRKIHPEYFPTICAKAIHDRGANMTPADTWAEVCRRRKDKDPLMKGGRSTEYRFMIGFPYAEDGTKLRKPTAQDKWGMNEIKVCLAHQGIDTKIPKDRDLTEADRIKNREAVRKSRQLRRIQFTKPVVVEYKGGVNAGRVTI